MISISNSPKQQNTIERSSCLRATALQYMHMVLCSRCFVFQGFVSVCFFLQLNRSKIKLSGSYQKSLYTEVGRYVTEHTTFQ